MARDTHRATGTNNQLFPRNSPPFNRSHTFEVRDRPIAVKVFNIPACVDVYVEMGTSFQCEVDLWGPYRPNCCDVFLSSSLNVIILGMSGIYRLWIDNPGGEDLSDMRIVQHEVYSHEPIPQICCCGCD